MMAMQTKKKPKLNSSQLKLYARYSSLAFQMLAVILIGVFGGIKLDNWVGWTFPVFTVVLSLTSVCFAIYFAIKEFLK